MLKKIFPCKYVGVVINRDKIMAYSDNDGLFFSEDIKNIIPIDNDIVEDSMNIPDYWLSVDKLAVLLRAVYRKTKALFIRPFLVICVPYEVTGNDTNRIVIEAGRLAGFSNVFLVNNIIVASFGSGVVEDISLIGSEEILNKIEELLQAVPLDIPEELVKRKGKAAKELLERGWNSDISKRVAFCVPEEQAYRFTSSIGKYELKKVKQEDCLINGMQKTLQELLLRE